MIIFLGIVGAVILFFVAIAIWDIFIQQGHVIQHNYPVIGHLRYFLESIGPELRQYWVADDKEEMPFNRAERRWVYSTAKKQNNTFGFGTTELLYGMGYPILKHSVFPYPEGKAVYINNDSSAIPCLKVIGQFHKRRRPFRPESVVNISAMSFGSLGYKAVSSINLGAKRAHCFQNTGEGGVSPYHRHGADLVYQLGTGYFGSRTEDGRLSMDLLMQKVAEMPYLRMIEIKLSQGAKPGKGGILPGKKVTKEIAAIRGVKEGVDCLSPNSHSEFSNADELIDFIERIADKTGLPVGIKSAIGKTEFWVDLARRMRERNQGPDFITIDGGEGGTGAAPLTFADHVSLPFKVGFTRIYQIFQAEGIADRPVWIGSAKLGFPDRAIVAFAMGCDMINVAREAMFAIGCIQAQQCHTDECPTGVTTHSKWRQAGVNITDKSHRLANYITGFRKELLSLAHAAGYQHPLQFSGTDIEFSSGVNKFTTLEDSLGYKREPITFSNMLDYTATP